MVHPQSALRRDRLGSFVFIGLATIVLACSACGPRLSSTAGGTSSAELRGPDAASGGVVFARLTARPSDIATVGDRVFVSFGAPNERLGVQQLDIQRLADDDGSTWAVDAVAGTGVMALAVDGMGRLWMVTRAAASGEGARREAEVVVLSEDLEQVAFRRAVPVGDATPNEEVVDIAVSTWLGVAVAATSGRSILVYDFVTDRVESRLESCGWLHDDTRPRLEEHRAATGSSGSVQSPSPSLAIVGSTAGAMRVVFQPVAGHGLYAVSIDSLRDPGLRDEDVCASVEEISTPPSSTRLLLDAYGTLWSFDAARSRLRGYDLADYDVERPSETYPVATGRAPFAIARSGLDLLLMTEPIREGAADETTSGEPSAEVVIYRLARDPAARP